MAAEGKPTGIKREEVDNLQNVELDGERAQLYKAESNEDGSVRLKLDTFRGFFVLLYGYFDGEEEFIEVTRDRIDQPRRR